MRQKVYVGVYISILVLFVFICVLSIFEFARSNSLSNEVKGLQGGSSQAEEIRKLQSDLNNEQKTNKQLASQLNELNSKYQAIQENYDALQSQVTKIQQTKLDNKNKKIAYLTFDDGPSKLTSQLLDTLKVNNVHATFFVVGKFVDEYPDIVKRAYSEGNAVGIHSWTHDYQTIYTTEQGFFDDFNRLKVRLTGLLGKEPNICRFPGGTNNRVCMKYSDHIMRTIAPAVAAQGIRAFDWDVDSGDADGKPITRQMIVNNIMGTAKLYSHPIILCHDLGNKSTTIEAIPEVISQLKTLGYSFGTLSPLVSGTEFKPY